MEQKLFFIGIGMGIFTWVLRKISKKILKNRLYCAFWHALFYAGAAFVVVLMLSVSMEAQLSQASATLYVAYAIALILGAAVWAVYNIMRGGEKSRDLSIKSDIEWSETIFSAVWLAAFVMYFFIQAFKIPSGSMRMTLVEGDHLFVNKFMYGFRIPMTDKRVLTFKKIGRGDVVVFRFPSDDPEEVQCGGFQYGRDFVKRVIGLPGDKVETRGTDVYINGKKLENQSFAQYEDVRRLFKGKVDMKLYQQDWESRGSSRMYGDTVRDSFGPVTVPAGSYMVMGDNRDHSCDSRYWGPVPEKYLKGKAWFVYWPPSRIKVVK